MENGKPGKPAELVRLSAGMGREAKEGVATTSMIAQVFHMTNYAVTPFAWPPFLVGAMTAVLGVSVLIRERGSHVTLAFGLVTGSVALWLLTVGVSYSSTQPSLSLWWSKLEHVGVVLIPSAVYLFALSVVRRVHQCRWLVRASFAFSAAFYLGILFTDGFITGVRRYPWGYYVQYGPLSIPFLIFFFGLMASSLRCFWTEYRHAVSETTKRRCKALLIAFSIGYVGSFDYLAAYGISLYPFGYLPVFAFLVVAARAIWRYRLVDITPAFAAAQIMDTIADALLVFDAEGVVRVANQRACRLFERSKSELSGQSISTVWGHFLPKEKLTLLLSTGVLHDYEATLVTREGQAVVLSISASVMRDRAGQPVAFVCLARDITERKRAEECVRQTNAELVQREHALTRALSDLKQSHEELQATQLQLVQAAKLESVGRLAAGVAHEVKNPLATLLIGVEHLADRLAGTDEAMEQLLQDMNHAVMRADAVIMGLLDFSSPETLHLASEDLNTVVNQSLALVKHELDRAHVRVIKDLADGLPPLPLDRGKIEQVFVNLFMNAIHAMPTGGFLSVKTSMGRAGQERISEAGAVRVEIEDTGSGIPEDKLPKIFDAFFTTKAPGRGTGLGLTVTKKIIELHRGAITVQNRPLGGGVQAVLIFHVERGAGNGQEADFGH